MIGGNYNEMCNYGSRQRHCVDFTTFADSLEKYGEQNGLSIHAMHEDIFNSMHRI